MAKITFQNRFSDLGTAEVASLQDVHKLVAPLLTDYNAYVLLCGQILTDDEFLVMAKVCRTGHQVTGTLAVGKCDLTL